MYDNNSNEEEEKADLQQGVVKKEETREFKVPLLDNLPKAVNEEITEVKSEPNELNEEGNNDVPDIPEKKILTLPYKEPKWSGVSEEEYSFEVLKNGIIINRIDLTKSPYIVFGRLEDCDVSLEHPSISRYHAVVQYKVSDDESKGFYIFDLGSTHGTFVNKIKITPKVYVRLKVGYVLKFGGSTRMFILQGPEADEEPESELTVTEIKELAKKRLEEEKMKEDELEKEDENEGINWGIADDAEEILTENPFALTKPSEEMNIEDPKKTLRGWFEREGCELEYKIEELGPGHFSCRIELPITDTDGATIYAEASLKGKKKDVNIACALEACRILDQHGLLRQAHHESRQKKKKWEETDFYASDEDIYLDRTGTIEKKRIKRKMAANKLEVETYETIKEKLATFEKEIAEIERKLAEDKSNKDAVNDENDDSLDAFLKTLKPTSNLDKATKSKLKLDLTQLQKQREHYRKLADKVQPTKLPPLEPKIVEKKTAKDFKFFIGKRKGGNTALKPIRPRVKIQPQQESENIVEEEEEEDSQSNPTEDISDVTSPSEEKPKDSEQMIIKESYEKIKQKNIQQKIEESVSESNQDEKGIENQKIIEQTIIKESDDKQENMKQKIEKSPSEAHQEDKRKENPVSEEHEEKRKPKRQRPSRKKAETAATYDESDPNYVLWLPPEDQKGDGRSHLNAKYGY